MPNFSSHKNLLKALNDITRKIETLVLNTPKNPYLNQATPKKYLPKFSFPQKIPKSKIANSQKSFDHPCHLKSEGHPCGHKWLMTAVLTSVFDVLLILVNAVFFCLRTSYTFQWRSPMAMLVSFS